MVPAVGRAYVPPRDERLLDNDNKTEAKFSGPNVKGTFQSLAQKLKSSSSSSMLHKRSSDATRTTVDTQESSSSHELSHELSHEMSTSQEPPSERNSFRTFLQPIKLGSEHAKDEICKSFQRSSQKGRALLNRYSFSDSGTDADTSGDDDLEVLAQNNSSVKDTLQEAIRIMNSSNAAAPASPLKSPKRTTVEKLYLAKKRRLRNQKPENVLLHTTEQDTVRKNELLLKKMMKEETSQELDTIQRYLGVCEKGRCLRHPNQIICGIVQEPNRFASIHCCKICQSEQLAGGRQRHRRSMAHVIGAIKSLHKDRRQWREKTKLMHHGKGYSSDEDSLASFAEEESNDKDELQSSQMHLSFCITEDHHASSEDGGEYDDEEWKEEMSARVAIVRAWDGKAALKCNPIYAKYFRLQNYGIPLEAIKQNCTMDGWDPRILDLDPNQPLKDQLLFDTTMTQEEKEDLLWQADHASDDFDNDEPGDIREIVNRVHEAYCKRKEVLDHHLVEEHKKKQARKWIGQDWGDLLKRPQERKQMPKQKRESETERELRLIEEEEEQAASAAASPLETVDNNNNNTERASNRSTDTLLSPSNRSHSTVDNNNIERASNRSTDTILSPSNRSHSTIGPLPTFFAALNCEDDEDLDDGDIESKAGDESCDLSEFDSSQHPNSVSDVSTKSELSVSKKNQNRKSRKGEGSLLLPKKSKSKKKLSFHSSDDDDSLILRSPRKPKSRKKLNFRSSSDDDPLELISPRKPKSKKKLSSSDDDPLELISPRKPKSKKKMAILSSDDDSIELISPRKPKSKKKMAILSSDDDSIELISPRKPKSKKKSGLGGSFSSLDAPARKPRSKKSLRSEECPLSARKKKSKKVKGDELSITCHPRISSNQKSSDSLAECPLSARKKKSKKVKDDELSITCHPRISSSQKSSDPTSCKSSTGPLSPRKKNPKKIQTDELSRSCHPRMNEIPKRTDGTESNSVVDCKSTRKKKSKKIKADELSTSCHPRMSSGTKSSESTKIQRNQLSVSCHSRMDSKGLKLKKTQSKNLSSLQSESEASVHPSDIVNTLDLSAPSSSNGITSTSKKLDIVQSVGIHPPALFGDAYIKPKDLLVRPTVDDNDPKETEIMRSELQNTKKMLAEKDIVTASLIMQVQNLQSTLDKIKKENALVQKENDSQEDVNTLKSELASVKHDLSEKNTILSSLVAQVQNLQTLLEEKNNVISAQAIQIENYQSERDAKVAGIDVLQKHVKNAEEDSSSTSSAFANDAEEFDANILTPQEKRVNSPQNDKEGRSHSQSNANGWWNLSNAASGGDVSRTQTGPQIGRNDKLMPEPEPLTLSSILANSRDILIEASTKEQEAKLEQEKQTPPQERYEFEAKEGLPISEIVIAVVKDGQQRANDSAPPVEATQKEQNSETKEQTLLYQGHETNSSEEPLVSKVAIAVVDGTQQNRNNSSFPGTQDSLVCHPIPQFDEWDEECIPLSGGINEDKNDEEKQAKPQTKKKKRKPKEDGEGKQKNRREKLKSTAGKNGKRKKRGKKKKKRKDNLDPEYLRAKFKETIGKIIEIRKTVKDESSALVKEIEVDRSSFRRSSSSIDNWIAPAEWNQYLSDDEEIIGDADNVDREGPAEANDGGNCLDLPGLATPSPITETLALRSDPIAEKKPTKGILVSRSDPSNKSKSTVSIRFSPETPYQETIIEKVSAELKDDLWYSNEDLKLFATEKYIEDHQDEFEVVESDDEEYSFYDEESYYSDQDSDSDDEEFEEVTYYSEDIGMSLRSLMTNYMEDEIFDPRLSLRSLMSGSYIEEEILDDECEITDDIEDTKVIVNRRRSIC